MVIVQIVGGLGNQMFQYAFARSLKENGYEVKLDLTAFESYDLHGGYQLDKYDITLATATHQEIKKFKVNQFFLRLAKYFNVELPMLKFETKLHFEEKFLHIDNAYLMGYFQTERYFLKIRNIILKEFSFNRNFSAYTQEIQNEILSTNVSISLHVRRGDYLNNPHAAKTHGVCGLSYYYEAVKFINGNYPNVKYFLFSDDVEWIKENLDIQNSVIVSSIEKRMPHEDMYLMSLCSHNIIANSSFSWWGAWLNKNVQKTVIAPSQWFIDEKLQQQSSDLIPPNWIRL